MSDLFEPLRGHDTLEHTPSPIGIRRRGDRLRRRRAVLTGAGTAAAVAAVAVSASLLGGTVPRGAGPDGFATQPAAPSATPSPATGADNSWSTRVPDDFPLSTGIAAGTDPDVSTRGPARGLRFARDLRVCEESYSPDDRSVDRVTFVVNGPEHFQGRDLTLFPDASTASAAARALATALEACPRTTPDELGVSMVTRTTANPPGDLGEESWTVQRGYEAAGQAVPGEETVLIVRTGNALLLTSTRGEGAGFGNESRLRASLRNELLGIRPVVAALCVFADGGCGGSAATTLGTDG